MSANDPTTPLALDATMERIGGGPASSGFTPGTIVAGRYRVIALLGRGGMGEVYRADDLRLGQPVALKFLTLGGDARALENLYHEVRVARQVSHPNVCRVHDVVEADGLRFIAMEYVDGEDLASLLRRVGRLPPAKALEVARDIASGLTAAHDRGIVHRDLKPGNVMIDGNGRAHITDFGLASLAGMSDGLIAGTPAYMAPEQVAGEPVTPQTDVYAFGLVLYELLTGQRVYESGSFAERRSQRARTPKPISAAVPDCDPALDRAIASCLEADRHLRPPSARALLARLPGGDPLDAAVAAGETPSPEMVAAAAERGTLSAPVAWSLFAAIAMLLPVVAWQSRVFLFSTARKAPEVLVDRAQGIVALSGEPDAAHDEAWSFDIDVERLRSAWGRVPQAALAAQRPGAVRFVYRRSETRLIPKQIADTISNVYIFQSGRVTLDDPPLAAAGDAAVTLDQTGALVEYRARPAARGGLAADWRPFLAATGVDLATLSATTPLAVPPVATDARVAWTARYPGTATPMRIEAATLFGRPAWLAVYGPWHKLDQPPPRTGITGISGVVNLVLTLACLAAAIFVALRSMRRGRSDRLGAALVAFYVAATLFLSWLLSAHHANLPEEEARMLSLGIGGALSSGVILWLGYLALEPGVRRRWPRSLIGWTRLLSGRTGDPILGRDVLVGIAGGIIWFEIIWVAPFVRQLIDGVPHHAVHAEALAPFSRFLGNLALQHAESIQVSIGAMFLYLLLNVVLRRRWLANAVWLLLATGAAWAIPAAPFFMALLLFVLLRWGLLAGLATNFTVGLLFDSPLTLDPSAWYFPRSACVLLFIAAAAAWAARRATATA